jgi:hypothetical protein
MDEFNEREDEAPDVAYRKHGRRPYVTPQLMEYGDVGNLTLGQGSKGNDKPGMTKH